MSSTVADALTELVRRAAAAAGHADAPVPLEPCVPTGNPAHGDYQSNFAFRLGKALRTNPREVAQALVDALPPSDLVARAEVAGPGFVNFHLRDEAIAREVVERVADPRLGAPDPGAGRTMVIDFSSPNVAKRMHVGHLRSTIIGDAIRRMYAFLGWNVVADNHVGDWGTQFGRLIVAWRAWRDDAAYADDPVGELERLYVMAGEKCKEDPEWLEAARRETAKLQAGDPENLALWSRFVEASMQEFERVYRRLDVRFDVVHGESYYRDALQPLVDELLERGIAVHSEGAVVVPFEAADGKGLGAPLLIRKRDGAALYGTTDLATIRHRVETWSPERIVYVTDLRQQQHFRQVFATARKMGYTDVALEHVWFGVLRFPDGSVPSSRAGNTINLVDVLDVAAARAREVVDRASPDLPEDERAAIAEAVGTGALRYFDLSQNPQSDIVFDWDRSLALDGNSAPYLMYAHARCRSILRRAADAGVTAGEFVIEHPAEREVALLVARTAEAVVLAASTYRPNLLCEHLYQLATAFSRFYDQCRVLDPQDLRTSGSRLVLTEATAKALATGLHLLGVQAPERM